MFDAKKAVIELGHIGDCPRRERKQWKNLEKLRYKGRFLYYISTQQ
jgi:hypothetical protein